MVSVGLSLLVPKRVRDYANRQLSREWFSLILGYTQFRMNSKNLKIKRNLDRLGIDIARGLNLHLQSWRLSFAGVGTGTWG